MITRLNLVPDQCDIRSSLPVISCCSSAQIQSVILRLQSVSCLLHSILPSLFPQITSDQKKKVHTHRTLKMNRIGRCHLSVSVLSSVSVYPCVLSTCRPPTARALRPRVADWFWAWKGDVWVKCHFCQSSVSSTHTHITSTHWRTRLHFSLGWGCVSTIRLSKIRALKRILKRGARRICLIILHMCTLYYVFVLS